MPSGYPLTPRRDPSERFWAKVTVGAPDECWLWRGGVKPAEYGRFSVGGRMVGAHRYSYELHHGPIPTGHYICHSCDVTACVNPAHLSAGTQFDNMRDAATKGRCKTPREGYPPELVAAVRQAVADGATQAATASRFEISSASVCRYVHGTR